MPLSTDTISSRLCNDNMGRPPPKSTTAPPSRGDMKQQAFNPIQRAPSRRGSFVEPTVSRTIGRPDATISHPVVMRAVPCVIQCNEVPPTSGVGTNAAPCVTHRNDTTGLHLPQMGTRRHITHVTQQSTPVMDTLNSTLYHGFIRRRFAPPRHQVVTEEVDRELYLADDKDAKELSLEAASVKKQPNEDDKEDVRSSLNELAAFGMVVFGFSHAERAPVPIIERGNPPYFDSLPLTVLRYGIWESASRLEIDSVMRSQHRHGFVCRRQMYMARQFYSPISTRNLKKCTTPFRQRVRNTRHAANTPRRQIISPDGVSGILDLALDVWTGTKIRKNTRHADIGASTRGPPLSVCTTDYRRRMGGDGFPINIGDRRRYPENGSEAARDRAER